MAAYGEDLAHIHDVGYSGQAEAAAPAVADWLRSAGHAEGLVVDLGCGGGHSSRCLVDAGYDVLGVDRSPALLERARRRVPEARFEFASFLDVEFPPCVAVAAIGEVFNYGFDARNDRAALARLFGRAYTALRESGLLVFDVLGPSGCPGASRSWEEGEGWAVHVERVEDPGARRLRRRIVHFRELEEGVWRRGEETHDVLLLPPHDVLADLREAGFRPRTRRGYRGERLQPGSTVYVARRP